MSVLSPSHPARKALRRWHNLAGLCVALLLVISGVSGSLLAYKKPLLAWTFARELPAHYGIEQIARDLDQLPTQIPSERLGLVKAPNTEEPYWQIITTEGRRLLLEPQTLAVLADHHWLLRTLEWLRVFHTELLAGLWGEVLLLLMSVLTLFLLVSGLWLWWPARKRLKARWLLPRKLQRKHLVQYHRHTGAVWLIVMLVVTLTGTVMLEQRLQHAFFPSEPPGLPDPAPQSVLEPQAASVLFQRAAERVPEAWPTYLRIPSAEDTQFRSRFRLKDEWHPNGRTVVKVNGDGRVEPFERADAQTTGKRLLNLMYPLHSGYGLNGIYQWLVFMSGLVCCWLAGTGVAHWLQRRKARLR